MTSFDLHFNGIILAAVLKINDKGEQQKQKQQFRRQCINRNKIGMIVWDKILARKMPKPIFIFFNDYSFFSILWYLLPVLTFNHVQISIDKFFFQINLSVRIISHIQLKCQNISQIFPIFNQNFLEFDQFLENIHLYISETFQSKKILYQFVLIKFYYLKQVCAFYLSIFIH